MANNSSAKKRIRQHAKRAIINRDRRSAMRSTLRKLEDAIASGDYAAATSAFNVAEPALRRSVTKGIMHLNTASRKISRLSKRVKALQQAAPSA